MLWHLCHGASILEASILSKIRPSSTPKRSDTKRTTGGEMSGLRTPATGRTFALGLALAVGITLRFCPAGYAAQLEKPAIRLAVGGKTLVAYLPLTIAERRGYFAKEGLAVEINDFQGGSKALEALVGGSADVVCGAYEHTLYMAAKGISIKAVALQANSFGLVVGIAKDKAYRALPDLKDMKIGVTGPGSASAMGLRMLLGKASLTPDDVSIIGVGGGAAAVAAVKAGRIDAIANFDPVISLLQRDGAIKTILDTRKRDDLDYLYGAPFAASAFYVDARFAQRNPETVQAFVNAVSAALAWLNKASTDDIVAAVPPEYYAGDRELYRAMIESNRERVSPDGRISLEAAEITYRNLAMFDDTLKRAHIDLAKTFDNSFVERAPALRAK
jgi:NitT/TauT family transport system substrate-binding protein